MIDTPTPKMKINFVNLPFDCTIPLKLLSLFLVRLKVIDISRLIFILILFRYIFLYIKNNYDLNTKKYFLPSSNFSSVFSSVLFSPSFSSIKK